MLARYGNPQSVGLEWIILSEIFRTGYSCSTYTEQGIQNTKPEFGIYFNVKT